jgi:MoaA/NifB/PqqE/SkfB family radical SAM enzyme
MPHKDIFCNVPWSNLHVYWDGSFGVCCFESSKHYSQNLSTTYNIKKMTISEWYNSDVMRTARGKFFKGNRISQCSACYNEEKIGQISKRYKENFKSVIFTQHAFERSYLQSPWYKHFSESEKNNGFTNLVPIDLHIDFGNECNLACKMCSPEASSKIAAIQKKNNKNNTNLSKVAWMDDDKSWVNFLNSIDNLPIKRIHIMGGEPTIIKKFVEFIDYLIYKNRSEISFSFVTNGTNLSNEFLEKLNFFSNFDLEISLESIDKNNDYIRQGSNIKKLLEKIENLLAYQNNKLQLVLRTVPQLLSINNYVNLIRYAFEKKIIIESIPLTKPDFLAINVLPLELRQNFVPDFYKLKQEIKSQISFSKILNGRNKDTINEKLLIECNSMINLLNQPNPENVEDLRVSLKNHLQFYDSYFKLNAYDYYHEYKNFLEKINYVQNIN